MFSVIIPVYNGEKTIARTLASLISSKDYIHEVIIVDDHSEDNTILEAEKFQAFLPIIIMSSDGYHNPGIGRKTGLLAAESDWVTFVDADDCLTPSCLRYVQQQIDEADNPVLLHSQTIYYESGTFVPENIGHADNSCGGNFYKRQFLIDNNLFPHSSLRMAEDEFFNTLITKYLEYIDDTGAEIIHYDYPVYEVHHDLEDGKSYALSNWVDYLIKYHLLCQIYLTDSLIIYEGMEDVLRQDFENGFIFTYMLLQGLIADEDENVSEQYQRRHFGKALKYYVNTFNATEDDLIDYYESDPDNVENYKQGAVGSVGLDFEISIPFEDFIRGLL